MRVGEIAGRAVKIEEIDAHYGKERKLSDLKETAVNGLVVFACQNAYKMS